MADEYAEPAQPLDSPQNQSDEGPVRIIHEQALTEDQQAEKDRRVTIDAFIKRGLDRWNLSAEGEQLQRRRSFEEEEFDSGKHWDSGMRKEREEKERVVIEINRTPQYLNQVANEERIARPAINVVATGNGSDPDTADVKAGMIRSIEKRSGAEGIRDDAFYRMLQKGWAYYRINDEYENERSFRRVIRTREIPNDYSVYCDPNARSFSRQDAKFYFIVDDMPVDEFREDYPHAKVEGSLTNLVSQGDHIKEWIGNDTIRVAEYFYKVSELMDLYALQSEDPNDPGNYIGKFEDELTPDDRLRLVKDPDTDQALTRQSIRERVYWAKISATEILEGNDDLTAGRPINSKYIPIVFLPGRRVRVEDRIIYTGMVRDAMEPCLASDYWMSAITEMCALAPKAPWIAPSKAVENYRESWLKANLENYSLLEYDHVDEAGNPIPKPERNVANPPIEAMTMILKFADDDLKRVMGIYNAGLGAPGPETSGVAIRNRQSESDLANFNYIDNLKRTIYFESQVYLDMMPRIYDEPQMVEITRPEGTTEMRAINKVVTENGKKTKRIDISKISYDSIVEIGASYETKREQATQMIKDYLTVDPTAAPLVGDLLARSMDSPDRAEIERRLKSRVPENLLQNDGGDGDEVVPPKFKAKYDKLSDQLEQITQAFKTLMDEVDTKKLEHEQKMEFEKMKLDSQERTAGIQSQTQLAGFATKADLETFKLMVSTIQAEIAALRAVAGPAPATPAPTPAAPAGGPAPTPAAPPMS